MCRGALEEYMKNIRKRDGKGIVILLKKSIYVVR